MDESPAVLPESPEEISKLTNVEQTQLILANLMEGGQEDEDTCKALDRLTQLLKNDAQHKDKAGSICDVIDDVCIDTILGYLDMRQAESVRTHGVICTAAYLQAAGAKGAAALRKFFFGRVERGTYDDYIVAFCVAAALFPIQQDTMAEMFLSEGFLSTLDPLMRRKWKSRKVETACLEMLNAASSTAECRAAIQKYCADWLEEIVDQDPDSYLAKSIHFQDPGVQDTSGSIAMRRHSAAVQHLAAVILAKMRAVPSATQQSSQNDDNRIQPASATIEDLSQRFTNLLLTDPDFGKQHSVEGLAYATIQPTVKEEVAHNQPLLKALVKVLDEAPAKSPLTYGALSIFANLTRYQPVQSEEEKKMSQLKAYANAAGKLAPPNFLNDNDHVSARCRYVFEAGIVPVLVTHSRHGSSASLSIIISIISSLSVTSSLRGQLAQQGAVNLLIAAWAALPDADAQAKRTAAQALARVLISTNPALVFGGTRARPQNSAIRPLASIIPQDPAAETRDLLPTFEALMALTNLASTDDDTRVTIIRTAWDELEEQLLSSNVRVSRAATELVCNLVQCVEGVAMYADGSRKAADRLHILLALADAEDEATRSAAGGALFALTPYEEVVRGILNRDRGVEAIVKLCHDSSMDIRLRGVFIVYNLISLEGDIGKSARDKVRASRIRDDDDDDDGDGEGHDVSGLDVLRDCAKNGRADVKEAAEQIVKFLDEGS